MPNCPLKYQPLHESSEVMINRPCTEEECAWWDYVRNQCAVLSIADSSRIMAQEPEKRESGIPGLGRENARV